MFLRKRIFPPCKDHQACPNRKFPNKKEHGVPPSFCFNFNKAQRKTLPDEYGLINNDSCLFLSSAVKPCPSTLHKVGAYFNAPLTYDNENNVAELKRLSSVNCKAIVDLPVLDNEYNQLTNNAYQFLKSNATSKWCKTAPSGWCPNSKYKAANFEKNGMQRQLKPRRQKLKRFSNFQYPGQDKRKISFRRGGRVQLPDGTTKRLECLSFDDFMQSWSAESEKFPTMKSRMFWCKIKTINPNGLQGKCTKDIKIRMELETLATKLDLRHWKVKSEEDSSELCSDQKGTHYAYDHLTKVEQPFFVRNFGWSAWSPQLAHLRTGIICRQLAVDDVCLVLISGGSTLNLTTSEAKHFTSNSDHASSNVGETLNICSLQSRNNGDIFEMRRPEITVENNGTKSFRCAYSNESCAIPERDQKSTTSLLNGPTKPIGQVPKYFSVASLAESSFSNI